MSRGGGELRSAIFRNFPQFSRNFSAIFLTSRFSDCPPTLVQNNENFFFTMPEIAEQWSLYIRCNAVDINGPTALQEWWQSRAPSPFQERVLFLITQPTSGGDVERFFSQCGTVSKGQHKLDDNIRRLRFMLQFHGDIEGRLL